MSKTEGLIIERYDHSDDFHVELAASLDTMRETEDPAPTMFPIGPEVLKSHKLGVIARVDETAVGYNGVIFQYQNGVVEMGGLYVNPDFRHRGLTTPIKAALFNAIREMTDAERVVTFANSNSLNLNLRHGFRIATLDEIPPEGLQQCTLSCIKYEHAKKLGNLCCDTILTLEVENLPRLET